MGCDIHLVTEVRRDGRWHIAEPFYPCRACGPDGWYDEGEACYWCGGEKRINHFSERSYGLFALLAGVRNYYEVMPLAEPRGLPGDSPAVEAHQEYDGCGDRLRMDPIWLGDHSFSWLTLGELLAHDWSAVDADFAAFVEAMKAVGAPDDVRIVFGFDN